jgi:hypothetical protein
MLLKTKLVFTFTEHEPYAYGIHTNNKYKLLEIIYVITSSF